MNQDSAVCQPRMDTAYSGVEGVQAQSAHVLATPAEVDALKRKIQRLFTSELVTIVGSGLSAAVGLPGMAALAEYLIFEMPKRVDGSDAEMWQSIAAQLRQGKGLESALQSVTAGATLIDKIVQLTATLVGELEAKAIRDVTSGRAHLPLRDLLPHLTIGERPAHIVTSNYDRLIEFAAEMSGLPVRTGFVGSMFAAHDPDRATAALQRYSRTKRPPHMKRHTAAHVALYKPHGSLDWFEHESRPVQCAVTLDAPRLMITPGTAKYRLGYNQPFDHHRSEANRAIEAATAFLVIGYGFNDDHLEILLRRKLKEGRSCVILTKTLTPNAAALVGESPSVIAFEDGGELSGSPCTIVTEGSTKRVVTAAALWDLTTFVSEVLQ